LPPTPVWAATLRFIAVPLRIGRHAATGAAGNVVAVVGVVVQRVAVEQRDVAGENPQAGAVDRVLPGHFQAEQTFVEGVQIVVGRHHRRQHELVAEAAEHHHADHFFGQAEFLRRFGVENLVQLVVLPLLTTAPA
jgi:hypothetical protein